MGRKKSSYLLNENSEYRHFGHHLQLIHKLPHLIEQISSYDSDKQSNAISLIRKIHNTGQCKNVSGILFNCDVIADIYKIFKTTNESKLAIDAISLLHEFGCASDYAANTQEIMVLIRNHINIENVTECFALIRDIYIQGNSHRRCHLHHQLTEEKLSLLNEINVVNVLVHNMTGQTTNVGELITFIKMSIVDFPDLFKVTDSKNIETMQTLMDSILFQGLIYCTDQDQREKLPRFTDYQSLIWDILDLCSYIQNNSDIRANINDSQVFEALQILIKADFGHRENTEKHLQVLDININLLRTMEFVDNWMQHIWEEEHRLDSFKQQEVIQCIMKTINDDEIFQILLEHLGDSFFDWYWYELDSFGNLEILIKLVDLKIFGTWLTEEDVWLEISDMLPTQKTNEIIIKKCVQKHNLIKNLLRFITKNLNQQLGFLLDKNVYRSFDFQRPMYYFILTEQLLNICEEYDDERSAKKIRTKIINLVNKKQSKFKKLLDYTYKQLPKQHQARSGYGDRIFDGLSQLITLLYDINGKTFDTFEPYIGLDRFPLCYVECEPDEDSSE
eukprot:303325_1